MKTLEDYLKKNAEMYADKLAVKCKDEQLTYLQLYRAVVSRSIEIRKVQNASSCQRGDAHFAQPRLVPFRASQSIDFLIEYFAIHLAGCVAMPLEKDMPEERFQEYQAMAESTFVPSEKSDVAAAVSLPLDAADVLFTTGTTGKSKGVIVSHHAIIADAENLVEAQGYHADLTFLICGPLNHIGSLSKVYPIILVGGTLVILEGMKDIKSFFESIERAEGKVATFLVPSSINMLLALAEKQLMEVSDKMEFIETGASAIPQTTMLRLCHALPHSRLYNTYASTETGIIATYDFGQGECLPGCLGKPMRHSSIEISENGKVVCGGDTLMSGYLGDEALTSIVLRKGKVHTQDLGLFDEQGRLRLQGRDGDVINVGGFKVNPLEVEQAALSFSGISDCICVTFLHPVLGDVLKLLYVTKEHGKFQLRSFVQCLKEKLEPYKIPQRYEEVERIERTYNGKLNRKFYR